MFAVEFPALIVFTENVPDALMLVIPDNAPALKMTSPILLFAPVATICALERETPPTTFEEAYPALMVVVDVITLTVMLFIIVLLFCRMTPPT